jgi:hypothetical protein
MIDVANMKRILLIVLTAYFCSILHSQQYECDCNEVNGSYNNFLQNLLISREYYNPIRHFDGEQYFSAWTPGNITLVNGVTVRDMTIRYDKYLDDILWLRQTDFKTGVINKSIVSGFDLYNTDYQLIGSFVKKRINPPGMAPIDAFLQVLAEGTVSLYVYRNVVQAISVSRTVDNTIYYICIGSDCRSVALRRKSLIKTPGIDKDMMKSIIRSNRLTIYNDETDLAKAVYLYNEAIR